METSGKYIIVQSTVPDKETADKIALSLLNKSLAACISKIPAIESTYIWQNEIVTDQEILLIIKTKEDYYPLIENEIKKLHPYEVPEVIALKIFKGDSSYLKWIEKNVTGSL